MSIFQEGFKATTIHLPPKYVRGRGKAEWEEKRQSQPSGIVLNIVISEHKGAKELKPF